MTRPHLSVVGQGDTSADDAEAAEMISRGAARMAEVHKTPGACYWLLTSIPGEPPVTAYCGGKLESSVIAEEIARGMKVEAVGLE